MRLRYLHLPSVAALTAISALPLHATIATYNSQAAFTAAATGLTTYTFPSTFSSPTTRTYTIGPLNFQQGVNGSPDGSYYATFNDGLYGPNQSYLELTNTTSNTEVETILLSTSATALALQIAGDGGSYGVAVNGANLTTLYLPSTDGSAPLPSVFFGITDSALITSISFTSNSTDTDILFAEVGSSGTTTPPVSAVPEPSTLALLGTGTLGLLGAARRRLLRS